MNRSRPRLKHGVDLQLQNAFSEGNWAVVMRLAQQRHRSLKDPYYEILRVCAESQVDDPSLKFSAVSLVSKYVEDGTITKDVDALDLLEWATMDLTEEDDFLDTLGPLRVRAVKASPKDMHAASRCLESCLIHWDLNSSQQIAAVLDRSFPHERHFMFWNIAITHLLSTSPQAAPDKRKLYGTLAFKQIERAAQASEQADDKTNLPVRGVQSEEEVLLLYDIFETHGSPNDYGRLIASPLFSPQCLFQQGRKELFMRAVLKYRREKSWRALFGLCHDCLSAQDEGQPSLLASDYNIWQEFILAASHLMGTDETAAKSVQSLLLKLIKSPKLRAIYRRNLLLARVSASFQLSSDESADAIDDEPSSMRLQELLRYVEDQASSPACFEDIKGFIEKLDRSGMKYLALSMLPKLSANIEGANAQWQARLLVLKVQYLITTCPAVYDAVPGPTMSSKCSICTTESENRECSPCYQKLWTQGLELYKKIALENPDKLAADPQIPPELALLVGFCSIKLAQPDARSPLTLIPASALKHLYHAILVLEYQLSFSAKNSQLLLVLVQLHMLLGSSTRSRQLWHELAVKRTIVDSLGPLFYDRLSTVAPALISPSDNWGWQVMDALSGHYSYSLKLRMPRRLVDAFESESYGSVLGIPKYITDLRYGATRAMSLIEETRSERFLGAPTWELFTEPRFIEILDETVLKETIDYGSFPSWDSEESSPIYARLRLGPALTNRRAHLSLLAESFHDVLSFKPPHGYKVSLDASTSDQTFVIETLSRVSTSFGRFLAGSGADLTTAEATYFDTIGLLSTLVPLCAGNGRPTSEGECRELVASVKLGLESLRLLVPSSSDTSVEDVVPMLNSMHQIGIYRDTASAALISSQWILGLHSQNKDRDRSGQGGLPKDLVTALKDLQQAAQAALHEGKGWIATLKRSLSSSGDFQRRFTSWVFEGRQELREPVYEDVIPGLVANIRENIDGWNQVKWE